MTSRGIWGLNSMTSKTEGLQPMLLQGLLHCSLSQQVAAPTHLLRPQTWASTRPCPVPPSTGPCNSQTKRRSPTYPLSEKKKCYFHSQSMQFRQRKGSLSDVPPETPHSVGSKGHPEWPWQKSGFQFEAPLSSGTTTRTPSGRHLRQVPPPLLTHCPCVTCP